MTSCLTHSGGLRGREVIGDSVVSGLNELKIKGHVTDQRFLVVKHLISFYEVIGDSSTFSFVKC